MMNIEAFTKIRRRRSALLALTLVATCVTGCATMSSGTTSNRYANLRPLQHEKIFIGDSTVTVRGIGASRARELNRYTCGSRGFMVCDSVASWTQCSCYR